MLKRFSFSFSDNLLRGFDDLIKRRCCCNHTEALHDLTGKTMVKPAWQAGKDGSLTMSRTGDALC